MTITGTDYSTPVMVNGFLCKNCTDVGLAEAHIDPQHPKAGPFGVNAKGDPTLAGKKFAGNAGNTDAVTLSGSLSGANDASASSAAAPSSTRGSQVDFSA